MKLGEESHVAREPRLATPMLMHSVSAQNENELVFACILTCYSKLQALLWKCSKFEWWCWRNCWFLRYF